MYQKPNKRLSGQTAIVTGASSGIGKAVAEALGKEGANVVINYISNPEAAEELAPLPPGWLPMSRITSTVRPSSSTEP